MPRPDLIRFTTGVAHFAPATLFVLATQAHADQPRYGLAYEAGHGAHTDMQRISANREWAEPLYAAENWKVGGYWDVSLGTWRPHDPAGGNHEVTDLGLTPVFRFTELVRSAFSPYAELAVGIHRISTYRIDNDRDLGTHFQFGDHVGAGMSFGPLLAWDVGVRFQHMSNAGLKHPNPGINFYQARVAYHF